MQMQLPLFPSETKLITPCLGVFEKSGMVYYLHNGSPIYCHSVGDMNNYRYITAMLVVNGLCKPIDLSKTLGVGAINFQRYAKNFREKGVNWFINREEHRGQCYKLNEASLSTAQSMLDENHTILSIAKHLGVTEGALRHHQKTGKLKKNK
jgi:hypothetical protein